jgi:hypothetical protein
MLGCATVRKADLTRFMFGCVELRQNGLNAVHDWMRKLIDYAKEQFGELQVMGIGYGSPYLWKEKIATFWSIYLRKSYCKET